MRASKNPWWVEARSGTGPAEQAWIGSGRPMLSAGCAGVRDHRVILFWNRGPAQGQQIGPVSNLNCG
ncbi:hypothetical protein [Streptomyces sp. KL116D]|uniref:hypothetical protein n=1 Tax=Streptomyces sp. KL116D TaxID=3045152 RepID=UPI0035590E38